MSLCAATGHSLERKPPAASIVTVAMTLARTAIRDAPPRSALAASKLVFAVADFRKHFPGRLTGKADCLRHVRNVRAQERVRRLFLAHGRWNRWVAGAKQLF